VTERLPALPAPSPWLRRYAGLIVGLLLTLLQARAWLWLWPLPQAATISRAGDPHLNIFYYAVVIALGATACMHYRLWLRAGVALAGLLFCWGVRALMG
jgi:hypothetical protein